MDLFEQDVLILIVQCVVYCIIFSIGVFLHVKVIIVLKRDQAMAWEINLLHSVVMIVHYGFVLIVNVVDYIQIAFYHYQLFHHPTFRYLVFSVICFGMSEMGFHSLYIAMYKYILIRHHETVIRIGEQRTKSLLLWTYCTGLFAWTLAYIVRPNFGPLHSFGLRNTFGGSISSRTPTNITSMQNTVDSFMRQSVSCGMNDLDQKNVGNIVVNIVTKAACTGQAILSYAVVLNVFEIFFYIRIFDHMNR